MIQKNNLLKFINKDFTVETSVNPARIFDYNNKNIKGNYVIYLCERNIRAKDNFALQFARQKSNELNQPLKIIHPKIFYEHKPKQIFIDNQIKQAKKNFLNYDFEIYEGENLPDYMKNLNPSVLIIDFNPISKKIWLAELDCKIYEVDAQNIVPARIIDKKLYNAQNLRRIIYNNIYSFLTNFESSEFKNEGDLVLKDFIEDKLNYYAEYKNNPTLDVTSGLSKYLNLGFISAQKTVLEIIFSNASDINKEVFLEELIIRRELAENFCLYGDFKSLKDIPEWAKNSLNKNDIRTYIYSLDELENSKTHDELWNATQIQLVREGTIHGYLRMYWAKKIAEWTETPEKALEISIYLNDKYAFDAPSADGYVGILWAIGGLHDRAFQNWPVTGKVRRMTFNSMKNKFKIYEYINKHKNLS